MRAGVTGCVLAVLAGTCFASCGSSQRHAHVYGPRPGATVEHNASGRPVRSSTPATTSRARRRTSRGGRSCVHVDPRSPHGTEMSEVAGSWGRTPCLSPRAVVRPHRRRSLNCLVAATTLRTLTRNERHSNTIHNFPGCARCPHSAAYRPSGPTQCMHQQHSEQWPKRGKELLLARRRRSITVLYCMRPGSL